MPETKPPSRIEQLARAGICVLRAVRQAQIASSRQDATLTSVQAALQPGIIPDWALETIMREDGIWSLRTKVNARARQYQENKRRARGVGVRPSPLAPTPALAAPKAPLSDAAADQETKRLLAHTLPRAEFMALFNSDPELLKAL